MHVFLFHASRKKVIVLSNSVMSGNASKRRSGQDFCMGLRHGIPIALGYLSVSFGFGIAAVSQGLSVLTAVLISLTNLTSAGQVAGLSIIVSGGTFVEMALAQLVINLRYALMSLSLSQKADKSLTTPHRLTTAFGITDEVFAVASGRPTDVSAYYMYGLILLPILSWTAGTLLGALAGTILPPMLCSALGLAIYGMFIAIIIPPARQAVGVCVVVLFSAACSCILTYVPLFSGVSSGFSIIICALLASVMGALFFPRKNDAEGGENHE